jgi:hypothetical protein
MINYLSEYNSAPFSLFGTSKRAGAHCLHEALAHSSEGLFLTCSACFSPATVFMGQSRPVGSSVHMVWVVIPEP